MPRSYGFQGWAAGALDKTLQSDCLLSGSFVKLDQSRDKPENQELSVVNCAEVIP